jgi:hypothetical protein
MPDLWMLFKLQSPFDEIGPFLFLSEMAPAAPQHLVEKYFTVWVQANRIGSMIL